VRNSIVQGSPVRQRLTISAGDASDLGVWFAQQEGELPVNILCSLDRHEAAPHHPALALNVLPITPLIFIALLSSPA
jgi:hypothetical protein